MAVSDARPYPLQAIQYMKIRDCDLSRLPDYFFMSLSIKHLYIIRSHLSVVENNALSSLAESLETIDFSSNSIKTVSSPSARRFRAPELNREAARTHSVSGPRHRTLGSI